MFPFFAEARNLEAITPPFLNFHVVSADEMRVGALIEYRLKLHGIPIRWLTRIEEWVPGVRFVDAQLRGRTPSGITRMSSKRTTGTR